MSQMKTSIDTALIQQTINTISAHIEDIEKKNSELAAIVEEQDQKAGGSFKLATDILKVVQQQQSRFVHIHDAQETIHESLSKYIEDTVRLEEESAASMREFMD